MPAIDQWTILRQVARSLEDHAIQTETVRARRNITEPCPVLDLLRTAPNRTIHDVLRVEAFISAHPFWGPFYLTDVITTSAWFYDRITTGVVQRNAVACLLELHPEPLLVKHLQHLMVRDDFRFESREAANMVVDWIIERHRNPKAFFAQPNVLSHVPAGRDLTELPAPDHPDVDFFSGKRVQVTGGNGSARVTWRANPGDLEIDYDKMRALAMEGPTATLRWLQEQSETGDQTRFADIDAQMAFDAASVRAANVMGELGIDDPAIVDALHEPNPDLGLVKLMDAFADLYFQGTVDDEDVAIMASQAAWLVHEYGLHEDADRAKALEERLRASVGV